MDWTSLRYLGEPPPLSIVEISTDMNATYDLLNKTRAEIVTVFAVFRMNPS